MCIIFGLTILAPFFVFAESGTGTISGYITDGARPLIGIDARVFAYSRGEWRDGVFNKESGSYNIDLPAGDWFVGAETNPESGFSASGINLAVTVNEGVLVNQDIALKRLSGVVEGKVLKPDGTLLENALINIVSEIPGSRSVSSVASGKDGKYRFFVAVGRYILHAFSSPKRGVISPEAKEFVVNSGQLANVSLIFREPDKKVSGRITSGAVSPAGARVWAWSEKGGYSETYADVSGNYELMVKNGDVWRVKAVKEFGSAVYASEEQIVIFEGADTRSDLELKLSNVKLPEARHQKVSLPEGEPFSLALENGMKVSIPGGAVPNLEFTVSVVPFLGVTQKSVQPLGPAYGINFYDAEGLPITKLQKSAILELPYSKNELGARKIENENNLQILYWDADALAWRSNGNSVAYNKDSVVIGLTDHFTDFVVVPPEEPPPSPPEESPTPLTTSSGGSSVTSNLSPVPGTPIGINARVISSSEIQINWVDIATVESGFSVERSEAGSDIGFRRIASLPFNSGNFSDTGLSPNKNYWYRVNAFNANGASPYTAVIGVKTLPDTTPPVIDNIIAETRGPGITAISWITDEPAQTLLNYRLQGADRFEAIRSANFTLVHIFPITVEPSKVYEYQIAATDEANNLATSELKSFTAAQTAVPLPSPQTPAVSPVARPEARNELITVNLRRGDRGIEVIRLQNFLIQERLLASGLNTGYFGNSTFAAVIRFQEANAERVLRPSGFTRGTGFVGSFTRAEINRQITNRAEER